MPVLGLANNAVTSIETHQYEIWSKYVVNVYIYICSQGLRLVVCRKVEFKKAPALTWGTYIYSKNLINSIIEMKNKVWQRRRNASWHIQCLSLFSAQASVIPPASLVVWEMWAGHAGIRVHHVGQLWRGHWKLCAPAGARTQALLQWRSRAGQLGEQSVITCRVITNTTLAGDSVT